MENETKPAWQSKAFWGGLIAAAASVAAIFGVELDAVGLTESVVAIIGAVGALLAIVGRFTAKKPLRIL